MDKKLRVQHLQFTEDDAAKRGEVIEGNIYFIVLKSAGKLPYFLVSAGYA